jgi:hypothetical protein
VLISCCEIHLSPATKLYRYNADRTLYPSLYACGVVCQRNICAGPGARPRARSVNDPG